MADDGLHEWVHPEDMFGPVAGARVCTRCGAKWAMVHVDHPPPRSGCPAERGRLLNREEIDGYLAE